MAGRPRKHTIQIKSHKTKLEIAKKRDEEQAADADDFRHMTTTKPLSTLYDERAKNEYLRIMPLLNRLDVTALDRQTLINYCNSYAFYRLALFSVREEGIILENNRMSLAVNIVLDMQKEMRLMLVN